MKSALSLIFLTPVFAQGPPPTSISQDFLDLTGAPGAAALMNKLIPPKSPVQYTNVTFKGNPNCSAVFAGGELTVPNATVNFPDEGIVLGTGDILDLQEQTSTQIYTFFNTSGDDDINTNPDQVSYDACVLEFEFRCDIGNAAGTDNGGFVLIDYVFASDEYKEQIGAGFADAFGLLLNGVNIATVPEPYTASSEHGRPPCEDTITRNTITMIVIDHPPAFFSSRFNWYAEHGRRLYLLCHSKWNTKGIVSCSHGILHQRIPILDRFLPHNVTASLDNVPESLQERILRVPRPKVCYFRSCVCNHVEESTGRIRQYSGK
jgi:hypothetical protein